MQNPFATRGGIGGGGGVGGDGNGEGGGGAGGGAGPCTQLTARSNRWPVTPSKRSVASLA